jgi:4-carboxymuconolactone decarboxylase
MELVIRQKMHDLDPAFGPMAEAIGEHAWGLPELSFRDKTFIFLAGDLCNRNLQMPIEAHVRVGLLNGVTFAAVREIIRHLAPYVGYPTAAQALMRVAEIEKADPPKAPQDAPVAETAPVKLPDAIATELDALDPHFATFYRQQFEQRWARPTVNTRERVLATIAVDVMYQTLDEPFALHLELARQAGATEAQVRNVFHLVAEYGIEKTWRAFQALDKHLTSGRVQL